MSDLLLMYSNQPPTRAHIRRLESVWRGGRVLVADSEIEARRFAGSAVAILGHRYLKQVLPAADRLQWVQSTAAGVDHLLTPELFRRSPILTRCPIFSETIAFHAYALALAVLRRIPEALQAQSRGEWNPSALRMLPVPETAMVLGLGCIGRPLAKLLRCNGITVLGVARTRDASAAAACDELLDPETWRAQLHRVDLCFIALPLTRHTAGLFDEQTLGLLPEHAVLVNVSRGELVDIDALADQLRSGRLGGAALDVLASIPDPADPLWSTPGLVITPKVAVFTPGRQSRLEAFIEMQVARFRAGEELLHPVDLSRAREEIYVP